MAAKIDGMTEDLDRRLRRLRASGDPDALIDLGCDLADAGRHGEAERCFRRAMESGDTVAAFNLGNALGLLYLLYFLQDVLGFTSNEAENRVFTLTAIYAGTLVLTTVVFGAWSDRLGRRKVFVIWAGLVAACASLLLGAGQSWPTAVVAAVVMGCSFGIYTSVDFALITEVLPGAGDRAKDLGVINIANALPQVVAPVLAGVLLAVVEATGGAVDTDGEGFSTGYLVVYAVAFLSSVLGSVFVTRIKGVR